MSDPYVGQITIVGFNFAPYGYAYCNGQFMLVNQFQALYSLIGNTFGGNASSGNFAVPNLQSRVPVHPDTSIPQGMAAGQEAVALTANEMPAHNHSVNVATAQADAESPENGILATPAIAVYGNGTPDTTLDASTIQSTGSGNLHNNIQPSLALNFCIALDGTYPQRS